MIQANLHISVNVNKMLANADMLEANYTRYFVETIPNRFSIDVLDLSKIEPENILNFPLIPSVRLSIPFLLPLFHFAKSCKV